MLLFNILMLSGWAYVLLTTVVAMFVPALENGQARPRAIADRSCRTRDLSYLAGMGQEFLCDRSCRHGLTNISATEPQTPNNNKPRNS